ncbi:hypothetical protein [Nocardioides currus]|uniref:Uncharacterized protein n=1 Tax=Nocardioides currus TaxID=2133958 RepID=A0A2R7YVL4_9ACTN|nr:hypothetical protein [Nocardioides currus]PUA80415.1 hypothetical protein C7S10_14940 [Nocardioides currus]
MASRRRTTHNTQIARGLGGRTGFATEELDRGDQPARTGSRSERVAAGRIWHDAINHFEDYADDDLVRTTRFRLRGDWLIALAAIMFFVGGYAAFIVFLATTR